MGLTHSEEEEEEQDEMQSENSPRQNEAEI
jgi:hypothetical protein